MNPTSNMTFRESAVETTAARSPIEEALERLFHQQERIEKAFAAMTERLSPILQPEEPSDLAMLDGQKSGVPRSQVANRLHATADDMSQMARRIESVTDRLDT